MNSLIDAAAHRSKAILMAFGMILLVGMITFSNMPREENPDVQVPFIYVMMVHDGITAEDAERLLLKPVERRIRSVSGVKQITSYAQENNGTVIIEFDAGFDSKKALSDIREKVDEAKADFPADTNEPIIKEINFSLFPVLNVILTGNMPDRALYQIARDLKDKIQQSSNVLAVDISGIREEVVEIIIDPLILKSYNLTMPEVFQAVSNNNQLIAAGSIQNANGKFTITVPGLIREPQDILNLPIRADGEKLLLVRDVAEVKKTFKDADGFARVNGKPSVGLEISKRSGKNVIETIAEICKIVEEEKKFFPANLKVIYANDSSSRIENMLGELESTMILAVILVLAIMVKYIGLRSGIFSALAIPGSFFIGLIVLSQMGVTLNIVVLFSLILAVGMLVDAAIIVCEYADRKMIDGMPPSEAYPAAAKRMSMPLISSIATTLVVFIPLLFWPGIVGQFMKYLPMTLIATLAGSLVVALIFIPAIGIYFGKRPITDLATIEQMKISESGDLSRLRGFYGRYVRALNWVLDHAKKFSLIMLGVMIVTYLAFIFLGKGVEFFPDVEPDQAMVEVRARGNISALEKDKIMREVEKRILSLRNEVKVFYSKTGNLGGQDKPQDLVGVVQIEFVDWKYRRKASVILDDIKHRTKDMAGVIIDIRKADSGPSSGKPVQLELSSRNPDMLANAANIILAQMKKSDGLIGIEDSKPIPEIEWRMEIDRTEAAKYKADMLTIGNFVKLITNGLKVSDYKPNDSDEEVDIIVRYPEAKRNLEELGNLFINTTIGAVPIANFTKQVASLKNGMITRINGKRVITIRADIKDGMNNDAVTRELKSWIAGQDALKLVNIAFKGEDKDQQEAGSFLLKAFGLAFLVKTLILLVQFNSIYRVLVLMSAVFISTVGVLLALLVTFQPFGIVMCGVAVIALAGVVVNNNIIFIDTYKLLLESGMEKREALVRTGVQRMRPILLTAITAILGLMPMVLAININFLEMEILINPPSNQWWRQLATSIVGGLGFATILTLFLTPALLMLGEEDNKKEKKTPSEWLDSVAGKKKVILENSV